MKQIFPPGPSVLEALILFIQSRGRILTFLEKTAKRYGDIIYFNFLGRHNYLLVHPDYIERIMLAGYRVGRSRPQPLRRALGKGLICSQGGFHQRMRRRMQPFFFKPALEDMAPLILSYAEKSMQDWKDGSVLDIEDEMIQMTLRVILHILFGKDMSDQTKEIGWASSVIHHNGNATPAAIFNNGVERIPGIGSLTRLARARKFMNDLIFGLIRERRSALQDDQKDLLSMLLRLQQTEEAREDLTDEQIRDEILTMLTAGHETIASALTWAWYSISENPKVEKKLHEELEKVLGSRRPQFSDLSDLSYAKQIFSETMRLYPPVWSSARRPSETIQIGDYQIPEHSCVYFTQYLPHRDSRFWENPERFDPERFSESRPAGRPKFAYFPFGGGNRQCIGEGMAWTEGLLIIAAVAQKWRFELCSSQRIELDPLIALQPKYGMRMKLVSRKSERAVLKGKT